jgi:hypothetical protein
MIHKGIWSITRDPSNNVTTPKVFPRKPRTYTATNARYDD